jgi:hypothetical protein
MTKPKKSAVWMSPESKEAVIKYSQEREMGQAEWVDWLIADFKEKQEAIVINASLEIDKMPPKEFLVAFEQLKSLQADAYNGIFSGSYPKPPYYPHVLSFGALNDDDMDRKLIEHIYNRLRRASGKEPISISEKPWWRRMFGG